MKTMKLNGGRRATVILSHDKVQAAKREFLDGLKAVSKGMEPLKEAVGRLVDLGIGRDEMTVWGTKAGFSKGWIRTVISLVMVRKGRRARRSGAGPVAPIEARQLSKRALKRWGVEAPKILLSAYRLVSKEIRKHRTKYEKAEDRGHGQIALAA